MKETIAEYAENSNQILNEWRLIKFDKSEQVIGAKVIKIFNSRTLPYLTERICGSEGRISHLKFITCMKSSLVTTVHTY